MRKIDYARIRVSLKKYERGKPVMKRIGTFAGDVKELHYETNPQMLGTEKAHAFSGAYARNLSDSVRLIFTIDYESHVIMLLKLGDHKETYGRD